MHVMENPELFESRAKYKNHARELLNKAVRLGILIRSSRCEDCGEVKYCQGHHQNYDYPYAVNWLCSACHGRRHTYDYRKTIIHEKIEAVE